MAAIIIRTIQSEDAPTIGELWEKLVAYHGDLDPDLPRSTRDGAQLYAQRIRGKIGDSHTRIFVAEVNGQVIGFVLGVIVDLVPEMFTSETGGFLADIYVEEAYRRNGVGRKLVQALADWFRSRGVTYLELYVANSNTDGRAFWSSLGGRDMMRRVRVPLKES